MTQKVDLMIGVDPAFQMERQMEVQQGGRWTGPRDGALVFQCLLPGRIRAEAGGAANGGVLALNLPVEHDLRGGIAAGFFIGQDGYQAFLQGAKTAFDLAFGLRARGNQRGSRPERRRRVGTRNQDPGHRPWNHGQRG